MRYVMFCCLTILFACASKDIQMQGLEKDPLPLAQELLEAARYEKPYQSIREDLSNLDFEYLYKSLNTDEKRLTFWMNVYNANIQLLLTENAQLFDDRGKFFSEPRVTVAGKKLSFDDIEHGIIRSSQIKLSGGFIPKIFVNKYERKMRTEERDGRIHFALNCGAKSCPPVAIYEAEKLNEQLDKSAARFLQQTSTYEEEKGEVYVTPLFSWFRGDFGGLDGVKDFLRRYSIIEQEDHPNLNFKDYDWTLDLGNYIDL